MCILAYINYFTSLLFSYFFFYGLFVGINFTISYVVYKNIQIQCLKFYLFIYWLCWVFIAVRGLSLVVANQGLLFLVVHGLLITGALVEHRL